MWLGNGREKIMERKFHQTAAENVAQIAHLISRFQATQPNPIPFPQNWECRSWGPKGKCQLIIMTNIKHPVG